VKEFVKMSKKIDVQAYIRSIGPIKSINKTYRRILVFDVETTGLIPKSTYRPNVKVPAKTSVEALPNSGISSHLQDMVIESYATEFESRKIPPPIETCPHILQLSYIIYNIGQHKVEETYNAYIRVSTEIEISEKITEITGITRETCNERGVHIVEALSNFYEALASCDCAVAHNLEFDKEMIQIELKRNAGEFTTIFPPKICNDFANMFSSPNTPELMCTMMMGINLCSIMVDRPVLKRAVDEVEGARLNSVVPEGSRRSSEKKTSASNSFAPATEFSKFPTTNVSGNFPDQTTDSSVPLPIPVPVPVPVPVVPKKSQYKKFPRLNELYEKLFRETPQNLHNSLIDSLVCLRCFLHMRFHMEIPPVRFEHLMDEFVAMK
jgi:DNA polymerase III epsilon subunit-like protein